MSKNNITGDDLKSRPNSKAFDENFDKIFGKKKNRVVVVCDVCGGVGYLTEADCSTHECYACDGKGCV